MDQNVRAEYESQALSIRADLKKWEGDWAAAHDGAKPGRDDIKQNAEIGMPTCQRLAICAIQIESNVADLVRSAQVQGV
jgi:hypothetical protein